MELDTADGIAKRFKLNPFTVRRMGYRGLVREFRFGRAVRYCPDDFFNIGKTSSTAT
jgi:hypothetical protein